MKTDVLEMLGKEAQAEKKRRKIAIECLEKLTPVLTEAFVPLAGTKFHNDEYNSVVNIDGELYFRYAPHEGKTKIEKEGFYVDRSSYFALWGEDVSSLQGQEFWLQVEAILVWIAQRIPMELRETREERNTKLARLEKIVAAIATIED